MSFKVEAHGAGGELGGHVIHDCKFVRRVFMDDRKRTVPVRREGEVGTGIEPVGVNALADRWGIDTNPTGLINRGDRSAQQPNRPADHELRKGVEFRCHNEHSPGREKDDRPNRQMSEEYDPQVCGSDGAGAADAIVVERYPNA